MQKKQQKKRHKVSFVPTNATLHAPQIHYARGNKIGRNDQCPCGSGKKYKKCCLARQQQMNNPQPHRRPRPVPQLVDAEIKPVSTVTNPRHAAAAALLDAGIAPEQVYAYMTVGERVTTANEASHSEETIAAHKAAVQEYIMANEADREEMLRPAREPR